MHASCSRSSRAGRADIIGTSDHAATLTWTDSEFAASCAMRGALNVGILSGRVQDAVADAEQDRVITEAEYRECAAEINRAMRQLEALRLNLQSRKVREPTVG